MTDSSLVRIVKSGRSGSWYGESMPVKSVPTKIWGRTMNTKIKTSQFSQISYRKGSRGRTFDDSLTGFLVEALDVSRLAHVQRSVDEDLQEGQAGVLVDLASSVSILVFIFTLNRIIVCFTGFPQT